MNTYGLAQTYSPYQRTRGSYRGKPQVPTPADYTFNACYTIGYAYSGYRFLKGDFHQYWFY